MGRNCGNCGTEMEDLGSDKHYCPRCDETFTVAKGKQIVEKKPTIINKLQDGQGNLHKRLEAVEDQLEIENKEAFPGF